jgi:hypothetical protein
MNMKRKIYFLLLSAFMVSGSVSAQQKTTETQKPATTEKTKEKGKKHKEAKSKVAKPKEEKHKEVAVNPPGPGAKAYGMKVVMRKLWEEHIIWTRNVICCLVDELPGSDDAVKRLLKNQDDIGNAVKPYYGEGGGNTLAALLRTHIRISADVVTAAKLGDNDSLSRANTRWLANADEIAAFLNAVNPSWDLGDLKRMMHEHLKLTTDEAMARIRKEYESDVRAYELIHDQILQMSDVISDGIVRQFPDKFADAITSTK